MTCMTPACTTWCIEWWIRGWFYWLNTISSIAWSPFLYFLRAQFSVTVLRF